MKHEKFHYASLNDVEQKARELGVEIPLAEDPGVLGSPLAVGGYNFRNRLAIQPMEGCDGTPDGSPDELTKRRYRRFAMSGAGLIWLEAVAVLHEGLANPRQLMLTEKNLDAFQALVEDIKETSLRENGFVPVIVMQATYSGRYSKPDGRPEPVIAYNCPVLEKDRPLDNSRIITDDRLKRLEESYCQTARLAEKAGMDGVDVKACHRYLMSELLSAFTRPGEYGGSFENRTRLFRNVIRAVRAACGLFITSRLNLYDGFPYPYGWGVGRNGTEPDMSEPIELVKILHRELGIELLNYTVGNPYANPHVNRPFDIGPYIPPEHPLEGVARICRCTAEVKAAVPEVKVISSGNSYLRRFSANMAAGMLQNGQSDMAGFGREAFAYPGFAVDILKKGALDPKKCCVACGKCSELMRAGTVSGCVVHDGEVYLPIYRKNVLKTPGDLAGGIHENV